MNIFMKDEKKILGENLRTLRKSQNLSREKVGELLGFHYATIGQIERGESKPSFFLVEKMVSLYKYKGDIRNLSKKNGVISNV